MAHSNQAQKRIRIAETRRIHNKGIASRMRTEIKRVMTAVESGDVEGAKKALPFAMKKIDKAAKTKILHQNAAAHRKSVLARAIASAEKN